MKKPIIAIILLLLIANVTHPFELKVAPEVGPTAFVKWVPPLIPVQFFIDSKGSDNVPFAQTSDAIKKAFNTWQGISGHTMRFTFAGNKTGAVASTTDQQNVIVWIEKNWPDSSFLLAVTKTSFLLQNPPNLVDADIVVNGVNFQWSVATPTPGGKVDIEATIQHEIGHMIGLQHSSVKAAKMLPSASSSRLLSTDEQAGIRFLYPAAPATDFKVLSPANGAVLLGGPNPTSLGFPLITYRWSTPVGFSNFTAQFSSVGTFSPASKVKSFALGASGSLAETTTIRTQLKNLAGTTKKLFWRVQADTTAGKKSTPVVSFTFE